MKYTISVVVTILFALLFLVSSEVPVAAWSGDSVDGNGRGEVIRAYDYNYNSVPLLTSFWFSFLSKDHHLEKIGIITEHVYSGDEIHISYKDKSWDNLYQYYVSHISIAKNVGEISGMQGECKGTCTKNLSPPSPNHHFILINFGFEYMRKDHHIDEIGIVHSDRKLRVYFNDKNNDDKFRWWASYMWVKSSAVKATGVLSGKNDKGRAQRPMPGFPMVIRGFKFNYRKKDHHIDEVGIWHRPGWDLQIEYNDKNDDDPFDWEVHWATLAEESDDSIRGKLDTMQIGLINLLIKKELITKKDLVEEIKKLEKEKKPSSSESNQGMNYKLRLSGN